MNFKSLRISVIISSVLALSSFGLHYADEFIYIGTDLFRTSSFALASGVAEDRIPTVEVISTGRIIDSMPIVSLTFDDSYESAYKHAPDILQSYNFKATYYIITNYLGRGGYMNAEQVLNLFKSGDEIGAHTRNHPNLTTLSERSVLDEISGSKKDLEMLGISVTTFAYPYGGYNKNIEEMTKMAGFTNARSINTWYNDDKTDRFALGGFSVNAGTPLVEVYKYLDEAVNQKKWAILVFHRINEDGNPISITDDKFRKILDYINKSQVKVMTVSDAFNLVNKKFL